MACMCMHGLHGREREREKNRRNREILYVQGLCGCFAHTAEFTEEFTPWKTNMDPENNWLVEENTLSGSHCQGLC